MIMLEANCEIGEDISTERLLCEFVARRRQAPRAGSAVQNLPV